MVSGSPSHDRLWGQRFVVFAIALLGLSVLTVWVFIGYHGLSLNELVSFRVDDGFCTPAQAYLGHCFADYSVMDEALTGGNFWQVGDVVATSYPAASLMPAIATTMVGRLVGSWAVGRDIFLALLAASLLTPAIWVAWRTSVQRAVIALVVAGFATAPFLVNIDRGNSTALVVAPLLGVALAYIRGRHGWMLAFIVLAALVKPQMILLVLLFIACRKYWFVLWTGLTFGALSFLAFLPFPGSPIDNISNWLRVLTDYSDLVQVDTVNPSNLNIAHSLLTVVDVTGIDSLVGDDGYQRAFYVFSEFKERLGLAAVVVVALALAFRGRHASPLFSLIAVCGLIAVAPGTSFGYYLALLLVPTALLLKHPLPANQPADRLPWRGMLDVQPFTRLPRTRATLFWTLVSALALLLTPLLVLPVYAVTPEGWIHIGGDLNVGLVQLLRGPLVLVTMGVSLAAMFLPNGSSRIAAEADPLAEGGSRALP